MPPNKPKPSIDGIHTRNPAPKRKPDLRPDHDLPAPEPELLLEAPDSAEELRLTSSTKKPRRWLKWSLVVFAVVAVALVAVGAYGYAWYQGQLKPVSEDTSKRVKVAIVSGTTPDAIAQQLESAHVIKSSVAFRIYTKLSGTEHKLKAGAYSLQPSLSTPAIVDRLVSGKQDAFNITFLPGDTLANNRKALIDTGFFNEAEIDAALNKAYDRPLFATKPSGTDLEGYIFGETYQFDASSTPESILNRTFDEFEAFIDENNLVADFQKQGLTLYEGITLASIVQREVPRAKDQKQIAGVFFNRLSIDMPLGSDVTYQYAAKKAGVAPHPKLESPYNTRIHKGLPPGPIAVPGVNALLAVAHPANNDYLYFLSGDDDITYFATTEAEHQANIAAHCNKKCLIN